MVSMVDNISRETQISLGAATGEPLFLVVLDVGTFSAGAPGEGTRFAAVQLFVEGIASAPALTHAGAAPPALPTVVAPDASLTDIHCSGTFAMEATTFDLHLLVGWNLVSVPPLAAPTTPADVFTSSDPGSIWRWDPGATRGSYHTATSLEPGLGYWVYSTNVTTASVITADDDSSTLALTSPGWNLFGPLEAGALPDPSSIVGKLWCWDAASQVYEFLPPDQPLVLGRGYWGFVGPARSRSPGQ